jgi:hypothetical protein
MRGIAVSKRAQICLVVFLAGVILAVVFRSFQTYRRRQRWKNLMASHPSLHVARQRIDGDRDTSEQL